MKNGKLKRGVIIALISAAIIGFIRVEYEHLKTDARVRTLIDYVPTEYSLKEFQGHLNDFEERIGRLPAGWELMQYVEYYDKYKELQDKPNKTKKDSLNMNYYYEILVEYTQKWRPTRGGGRVVIIKP